MDNVGPPSPPGWAEALACSLAELAAGQTVPAAVVHDEIRQALAALEAEDGLTVPPAPGR